MVDKQMAGPIKVVILEDGKYERKGMIAELESEPDIEVVEATSQPGDILKRISPEEGPDVAFIDLRIYGDMTVGSKTIREIKKLRPEVKCIVLTAFVELENFLAAFDAGAEGFIRKDARPEQQPPLGYLAKFINSGGRYYDSDVVKQMREHLDLSRLPLPVSNLDYAPNPLTLREREVLAEMAGHHTNAEIADRLKIAENTVKAHIGSIMSKLGAQDRHEAVLIGLSKGWLNGSVVENG